MYDNWEEFRNDPLNNKLEVKENFKFLKKRKMK
jgi:hypothetical protein